MTAPHPAPERRRLRGWKRLKSDDSGFSLIEVVVASGVVFSVLLTLAYGTTTALQDIGLARQRQGATAIANRLLEQVRGMEYDTMAKGLRTSDLTSLDATDDRVSNCGGTFYLTPSCPAPADAEEIVNTPGLDPATSAPLVPYRQVAGEPPAYSTTYTRSVYITEAENVPAAGAYRVTVYVSWSQARRGGVSNQVEVETLVFSPEGCVDQATHTTPAPCSPYFYATSIVPQGGIDVTGTVAGQNVAVRISLPSARTDAQHEQVSNVQSAASGADVSLTALSTSASTGNAVSSAADDSQGTSPYPDEYESNSFAGASPLNVTAGGAAATLGVSSSLVGIGDVGSATSAMSAGQPDPDGGTQDCPLPPSPPAAETDSLPCGGAVAQQGVNASAAVALSLLGVTSVSAAPVASVNAATQASRTNTDRDADGTNDGKVIATTTRNVTQLDLLGAPRITVAGVPPLIPDITFDLTPLGYYLRLSGYSDSAMAQAGTGTIAPTASVTGGSLSYCASVVLNICNYGTWNLTGTPPTLPTIDTSQLLGGNLVRVQLSGTITKGTAATSETATGSTRTAAQASVGSPIRANLTQVISVAGIQVVNVNVVVDLGTALARASYKAATV